MTGPSEQAGVDDIFDRAGSMRSMALLRIALGPIVVIHLWPTLLETAHGTTYLDRFNEPWFGAQPEVPGGVQVVLVWGAALAAVAMTLGWHTRPATVVTTGGVAGNLFLSQTHFHHNRAFLLILLAGVSLSDSGCSLSLDARRNRSVGGTAGVGGAGCADGTGNLDSTGNGLATLWPVHLLRVLVASVYFASGFSKLIDPDWRSGLVNWDRAVRGVDLVATRVPEPLASWVVEVSTTRWVQSVAAPVAIGMELFIAGGLWFRRTRLAAVWVALVFHVLIEVSASVQVFSLAAIAALVIWTTPITRDRIVVIDPRHRLARWLPWLDWLARFEVRRRPGADLVVHDRDNRRHSGREALLMLRSRLPLFFVIAGPRRRFR